MSNGVNSAGDKKGRRRVKLGANFNRSCSARSNFVLGGWIWWQKPCTSKWRPGKWQRDESWCCRARDVTGPQTSRRRRRDRYPVFSLLATPHAAFWEIDRCLAAFYSEGQCQDDTFYWDTVNPHNLGSGFLWTKLLSIETTWFFHWKYCPCPCKFLQTIFNDLKASY